MKKIISFSIVLLIAVHSFGQQVSPQPQMTKQDYLQKSKRQKTTAFVMLGAGSALAVTGVVVYNHAYKKAADENPLITIFSFGTNVNPTGALIFLAGSITAIASIPLFVLSSRNQNKALYLSLKNESASTIVYASLQSKSFPAVSLRLNL